MPDLANPMHIKMLKHARALNQPEKDGLYGLHWGDPNNVPALRFVRDEFIYRYLNPNHTAIEVGPGGGRWTRYLLSFGHLYAFDYHQELLDELAKNFKAPHLVLQNNNGNDFPGIADRSIDFIFSFGVFVHIDLPIIEAYLDEFHRVLKPGGNAVLQYSDKTKPKAQENPNFSQNNPNTMRRLVNKNFLILEENLTILPHSAIIRFTPKPLARRHARRTSQAPAAQV